MSKKKKPQYGPSDECLRLSPENRLCNQFDAVTIKEFAAPDRGEMGFRVLDNFPEEHIQ